MTRSLDTNDDGSHTIMLAPCPTATVAQLLDPSVPFVWVVGHSPHRVLEWWELDMPFARGEQPRRMQVRSLWCELFLDITEFTEAAGQFDGVTMFHMAHPVPDTLSLDRLTGEQQYAVLRQNGLVAHFHQPHSMEVAMYRSWDHAWVQTLLARESIARFLL